MAILNVIGTSRLPFTEGKGDARRIVFFAALSRISCPELRTILIFSGYPLALIVNSAVTVPSRPLLLASGG